jgi:hypothetical protein
MCPIIEQLLAKSHHDFQWEQVKYNTLKTATKSKSQLEGHEGKLHSDFHDILQHLGPSDHQMLVIIAHDEFNIYHLPHRDCNRKEMKFVEVGKGKVIAFKAECLHSGGEHLSDHEGFQLFAYVTNRQDDIPQDVVELYSFDSNRKVKERKIDSSKLQAMLKRQRSQNRQLTRGKIDLSECVVAYVAPAS